MRANTLFIASAAMVAFAANSLLCRMALGGSHIDAASFTSVRVLAGAATLLVILLPRWRKQGMSKPDWRGVLALYAYMIFFSFAYVSLDAGTGALILFGAVQVTMFVVAMRNREYFPPAAWIGFLLAVAGLVYLVSPGVTAPSAGGATLMAIAGIAWGAYSLIGRTAPEPLSSTATSFIGAVPLVLMTSAVFAGQFTVSANGLVLAVVAGAVTSGLGYVTWYAALRDLSAGNAATIQLTVPLIAAIGGALFLSEAVTLRLLVSSAAILGGVALVLAQRSSGERR